VAVAGEVAALRGFVKGLPKDLPASLFIVLHTTPAARSHLSELLTQAGRLPATTVANPIRFLPGRIYVAPPDHHLLLSEKVARVERSPRENRHRPSIDVLFRSAAGSLGPRVIGIVLTGVLSDGTAGLAAIKEAGGIAIVQDPREASFPGMPQNALRHVRVDYSLPIREMPARLMELLRRPSEGRRPRARGRRSTRTVKARLSK
jgi:two-component system chemotaxis response regulator CheB